MEKNVMQWFKLHETIFQYCDDIIKHVGKTSSSDKLIYVLPHNIVHGIMTNHIYNVE